MTAEDFAYKLQERPGSFYFLGSNTTGDRFLHKSNFTFTYAAIGTDLMLH